MLIKLWNYVAILQNFLNDSYRKVLKIVLCEKTGCFNSSVLGCTQLFRRNWLYCVKFHQSTRSKEAAVLIVMDERMSAETDNRLLRTKKWVAYIPSENGTNVDILLWFF